MKRDVTLWIAVLAGPIVWFASVLTLFALAPWGCALRWKPALFATSAVAILIAAASSGVGWMWWRRLGRESTGEAGGAISRSRALASGGLALGAMFFLVILAQLIVTAILGACE